MSASGLLRRFRRNRPGFRPMMDTFESRQLLTTVTPFLQGTVFADSNSNGTLDQGEAPVAGARINLYAGTSTTPVATTTSGSDGGYVFNSSNVAGGLTVGATYTLVESANGYSNTGAQALSSIDTASVTAANTIQVTVVDPNKVTPTFTSPVSYSTGYDRIDFTFNGGANETGVPTQLNFTLSGDPNVNTTSFTSLCVGINDRLSFNTPFATVVDPQTALPNGGQIAYLYNHYGTSVLTTSTTLPTAVQGLSPKNIAAGLQIAVWELEYGNQFAVTGYDSNYTTPQDYIDLQTAAAAFLTDSVGKSEKVAILDDSLTGSLPANGVSAGGQSVLAAMSYNFGNKAIPLGSLSGFVYADSNSDGSKGATEAGISGVTLTLINTATGQAAGTTTTDNTGAYSFGNLTPGTYSVVEGPVAGYLPTSTNTGTDSGIVVAAGTNTPNNNFGEIQPGVVSGFVYADSNSDGLKNGTDKGLSGINVTLINTATSKPVGMPTTTGSDGSYLFTGVAPGTYSVVEGTVAGYLPTTTNTGTDGGIVVTQGSTSPNNNFGEIQPGIVSGFVYADSNADGIKETGEAGLSGITVTLINTATGKPVGSPTTTDANGAYSFTNLVPGTYSVVEGAVASYLPTVNNTGTLGGITVTQGSTSANHNFGEILPGSIAGVVFLDKTGDGLSSDDTALQGVTVQLVNSNNVVIGTQTVGANGAYNFGNLAPGTYTVREIVPTGYVQTGPASLVYTVPLAVGQNVTGENFDNFQMSTSACPISNISYTDLGSCGVSTFSSLSGNTSEGDQVTVNFTVGGTSPVTVSFVTYTATSNFDLTKQAIFSVDTETLAPGQHSLTVMIPNSYYQIDFVCGSAIATFNPTANITYHGEGRFIDADHGGSEVTPASFASLAGSVFVDNNYDGVFGSKDSGLGGVTVRLTGKDLSGQTVSLTRLTASNGTYSFNGLQPGTYSVSEVTPTGYFTTKDSVGSAGGTLANPTADLISAITLAGGTSATSYNFGEQAVGNALGCNQTASTCFWNGCSGQNLIRALNGSSSSTSLGTWLAAEFPNSFSSLAGKTNAQVASFYQSSYNSCHYSPATETLATALAAYVTDSSLAGGNYGCQYGFSVTTAGASAATVNIGTYLACYGGPQGTVSLFQLLQYADSVTGSCDCWLQYRVACVFDYINNCGNN